MSMMLCAECGSLVDTDDYPQAFLVTVGTLDAPRHKQDFECICPACQDHMDDDEIERRQPR